ncbi:hypothetical protein [Lentzea aerocolonigenes]|uniref:hypothetical protein n=1 Tax=Lentzea aerocolonigenes TaxID=68170 RepID=UPI000750BA87|nr:hypothetical protein [Lentzea aerocolonigenes]MCP2245721.1 hypothetical protein [Lentzea aerocolonigenes]
MSREDRWEVEHNQDDGHAVYLTRPGVLPSSGERTFEHFTTDRKIRVKHKHTSKPVVSQEFPDDLDDDALARAIENELMIDLRTARAAVQRLRPTD